MTAGNANYDALLTTTIEKYARKTLTDNIFTARPLTYWLMDKNRMRFEDGGAKILEPIVYGPNNTVASYSGTETLNVADDEPFTNAEFDWKQLAAGITFSGIDQAKNSGDSAVINLLEAKMMNAEESIRETLGNMLFADGTGNSGKDWLGLEAIVGTADLGGIVTSANTWWESTVNSDAAALTAAQMTSLYNTVSKGNDHPDFGITTQLLFEKYESLLQPQLRFQSNATADAGFQNLMFKDLPVMFDAYCQSGTMYMLNSKYIALVGHSNVWFKNNGWIQPYNVDARMLLLLSYGNLTVRNRARHGKLTAKTA